MSLLTLVVLAPLLAGRAAAQTVTAVCTYAQWTFFQGNSPCQIWANLQAVCNPNASVGKLDTSIDTGATYPAPSGSNATACQCNVVAYNLMAGCSWCQPNVYSVNWISEAQWKGGCSSYVSTGLPPQASSVASQIPQWAMLNENGQSWHDFDASSIAAGPTGITGAFLPTATRTAPGSSYTYTGPFSGGGAGNDTLGNVISIDFGKAIGIPVGILLGSYLLLGGIVLVVFLTRQRNRKAWYGPTAAYYRNGGRFSEPNMVQPLLGPQQSPNPFAGSPSGTPNNSSAFPASPYQPTLPPSVNQYDPNANYLQGYQTTPFQTTPSPAGGQYANTYYDPNAPPAPPIPVGMPQGPSHHVPEL